VRDSDRRDARIARREEGACRAHVTDEQRREAGCLDGQNDAVISGQALSAEPERMSGHRGCLGDKRHMPYPDTDELPRSPLRAHLTNILTGTAT
jgi:hypothetical protein